MIELTNVNAIPPEVWGKAVAGTGHRPPKLLGYGEIQAELLRDFVRTWLYAIQPDRVISGMALGFDMALATAAIDLNLPLTCALPCKDQDRRWPAPARKRYADVLAAAETVVYVHNGEYTPQCMLTRDEWMVDHAQLVLALYNGERNGGTAYTVAYARRRTVPVANLWAMFAGKFDLSHPEKREGFVW